MNVFSNPQEAIENKFYTGGWREMLSGEELLLLLEDLGSVSITRMVAHNHQ